MFNIVFQEFKDKKNKGREDLCRDIHKVYRAYYNQGK